MTRNSTSPLFRLILLAAVTAVLGTAAVVAQAAPAAAPAGMIWIGDLDTNHDGRITPQEAEGVPLIAKNFAAIDTNKHGYISMSDVRMMWHAELVGQAQASVQARMAAFTKADTNKDGKLSPEEAKAAGMNLVVTRFKDIDTNHDGFVSKDEMLKVAQALAGGALAARGNAMQALFTKADTNKDGKLSQAEFAAAFPKFAKSFAFFDENHDGSIEPNEFALPPH